MLHLWGESVQHLWLHRPSTDMARSARLFLCARCRDQVLLCPHCDRGQVYCSRACSVASRHERRRHAAQLYQDSRGGRLKHAARAACWRARRRSLRQASAAGDVNKVTHQGCPGSTADDSLQACDTPNACEPTTPSAAPTDAAPATLGWVPFNAAPVVAVPFSALVCRRCAHALEPRQPNLRQGPLLSSRVGPRSRHDHPS